jgi:hypothetical protein
VDISLSDLSGGSVLAETSQDRCWSCQGPIGATDNFCPHCGAAVGASVQDAAEGITAISTAPMSERVRSLLGNNSVRDPSGMRPSWASTIARSFGHSLYVILLYSSVPAFLLVAVFFLFSQPGSLDLLLQKTMSAKTPQAICEDGEVQKLVTTILEGAFSKEYPPTAAKEDQTFHVTFSSAVTAQNYDKDLDKTTCRSTVNIQSNQRWWQHALLGMGGDVYGLASDVQMEYTAQPDAKRKMIVTVRLFH